MGRRILIVDDHAGFRTSARRILEAHGFEVVGEAEDGSSGVTLARELRPEVVLLDLQLPDIDGFEVAAQLRDAGVASAVVLTSSRDWSDVCNRQRAAGAVGFIPRTSSPGLAFATWWARALARSVNCVEAPDRCMIVL